MKYSIFVSLLVCFILFPDDIKANFTRDDCFNCCHGLTEKKDPCLIACTLRFSKSQDYNSRNECRRSCTKALQSCRIPCYTDCAQRYEFNEPGKKVLTRDDKERLKVRKAAEFLGLTVYKTTPRAPDKPKRIKRNKSAEPSEGTGSN